MTEDWPFRGGAALASGALSARHLARFYTAVYPGVYAPRWVELSAVERAHAAWLWSRREGVLAGLSASALLGAKWIEPTMGAELVHSNRRAPQLLTVHTDTLLAGETVDVDGMTVTSPARTAFDLGRRRKPTDAVQRVDALMNATGLQTADVQHVIDGHPGVRGLAALRRMLPLVDAGAESPYESLTRLILVRAGLPPPVTQLPVMDSYGFVVAYVDMGWPELRVAVEYDGAQHWTDARQRRRDIERLADLEALGWIVIRVSSDMVRTPAALAARVRGALERRSSVRISTPRRRVS
ncbi:MAG: endonuclease domain-containing protein [Mycobacterium sp.]